MVSECSFEGALGIVIMLTLVGLLVRGVAWLFTKKDTETLERRDADHIDEV